MRYAREHLFDSEISRAAAAADIPPALLKAIVAKESEFNPTATALGGGDARRGGSYGLVQMSLATARALGFIGNAGELYQPATNLTLGARYLRDLLREAKAGGYGIPSAISAYNGGNSTYRRGDGRRVGSIARVTPEHAETVPFINQAYVDDVLELMRYFESSSSSSGSVAADHSAE